MNISLALIALSSAKTNIYVHRRLENIPESFDWRPVGPVQKQGHCQSCWAFSAAGSIDHLVQKDKPGFYVDVQALLDCTPHTLGCEGGVMQSVFEYTGIYPLRSTQHYSGVKHKCEQAHKGVTVTDYKVIISNVEAYLDYVVYKFGPIAVGIDSRKLGSYSGGIIRKCGTDPNHAVVVVGYTPDYWIVKNSHGTKWGDKGYGYISRSGNVCGISEYAAFATEIEYK